jgi:hypothetical protein
VSWQQRVRFPGQEPNERILLVLRRHWYVVFVRVVAFAFAAFLPGVLLLVASVRGYPYIVDPTSLPSILGVLGLATYELLVWVFFYVTWLDYELDIFIVTDERIVNIAQNGLFHRTVSEQRLFRVQDVTSEVKGIVPTFLRFGTVYVQTAGEKTHFVFRNVPNPDAVAKVILDQIDKLEERMGLAARAERVAANTAPRPGPGSDAATPTAPSPHPVAARRAHERRSGE